MTEKQSIRNLIQKAKLPIFVASHDNRVFHGITEIFFTVSQFFYCR